MLDPVVDQTSVTVVTSSNNDNALDAFIDSDGEWKSTDAMDLLVIYQVTIHSAGDVPLITDVEVETSGASDINVAFLQADTEVNKEVS